ncbi:hypothetical protein [Burkholderia sp. Ac-20365]|uniref:hypothetical protein n=1 Tax=Burkholderia sp. Ac-20365 TaxID=2703897 RepID=UPI00197C280B|nr:hypothetical protein [Burkholderia sp. Ac-20365]
MNQQTAAAPSEVHEFLFDVKLDASIRLRAPSEAAAREALRECLNCGDANLGEILGQTIVCEVSLNGEAELAEVDDVPTDRSGPIRTGITQTQHGPHVRALLARILVKSNRASEDGIVRRLSSVNRHADAAKENFAAQMEGVGAVQDDAVFNPDYLSKRVGDVQDELVEALNADAADASPTAARSPARSDVVSVVVVAIDAFGIVEYRATGVLTPMGDVFVYYPLRAEGEANDVERKPGDEGQIDFTYVILPDGREVGFDTEDLKEAAEFTPDMTAEPIAGAVARVRELDVMLHEGARYQWNDAFQAYVAIDGVPRALMAGEIAPLETTSK